MTTLRQAYDTAAIPNGATQLKIWNVTQGTGPYASGIDTDNANRPATAPAIPTDFRNCMFPPSET